MFQVQPFSGAIGGIVQGVDLCRSIDETAFAFLRSALLEYEVLFFRDQPMSPENHAAFDSLYGQPQLHEAYDHVYG
jgi:taurine dioxygenase